MSLRLTYQYNISENHKVDIHKDKIRIVQTERHRPKIKDVQEEQNYRTRPTYVTNRKNKLTDKIYIIKPLESTHPAPSSHAR